MMTLKHLMGKLDVSPSVCHTVGMFWSSRTVPGGLLPSHMLNCACCRLCDWPLLQHCSLFVNNME